MNWPDLMNGAFELGGGALCWLNVRTILRERKVAGVLWPVAGFFSAWGAWNLYFYAALGCPLSFWGGVLLLAGNSTWVALAVYYQRKNSIWAQHAHY